MKFRAGQRVWHKTSENRQDWTFICLRFEGNGYWRGYYEKTDANVDHIHEDNFEATFDPNDIIKNIV